MSVIAIAMDKVVATVAIDNAAGVQYDPANGVMYVVTLGGDVYPVSDKTMAVGTANIVNAKGSYMSYSPTSNEIYMSTKTSVEPIVDVINPATNSSVARIETPNDGNGNDILRGIAYDSTDHDVYVVDSTNGYLTQIGPQNTIIASNVLPLPFDVVFNPSNDMLYVTSAHCVSSSSEGCTSEVGQVLVVNPGTLAVTATITCPTTICKSSPIFTGIAYDSSNGLVYVADAANNQLVPISGTTIVTPAIPTGAYPFGVIAGNPVS